MDAAFENPLEDHRLYQRTFDRSVSMGKSLTETEFAQAVTDGLPQLIAVARRLAGNEELAAEAVQNALLKASKSWRKFRGTSHVNTWLIKIVIHAVRDAISSERCRVDRTQMLPRGESNDQSETMVDPGEGPAQHAVHDEFRSAVLAAVHQLPDRQREVFGLMVWQGLPARQVGVLLDISPQSAHANLHSARNRLRELLHPFAHDDQD